jgi:hypothetical protein
VVYRGVGSDYYLTGAQDNIYQNIGFVSTSMDANVALKWLENKSECCIQKILLLKGTRAIFLTPLSRFPNEQEILLNHGCVYYIKTASKKIQTYKSDFQGKYNVCYNDMNTRQVSELIVTSK